MVSVGTVKGLNPKNLVTGIRFWALLCGYDFFFLNGHTVFDYLFGFKRESHTKGADLPFCVFGFYDLLY